MSVRPVRPESANSPRRGWRAFVRMFGWRAYALPVLVAITVLAVVRGTGGSGKEPAGAPAAHRVTQAAGHGSGTATGSDHHSKQRTDIEGLTEGDAGFRAGSTPKPISVQLGSDVTSCAQNGYDRLVLVSISRQHLWACDGHRQVNESAVTTGKVVDNDQTPLGSWRVQGKQRDRYLVGAGYRDYVKFWVPFNGDFGLHDASWQTMPFGGHQWRTKGSHGCVHVPTPTMAWLYHWARVGSTVVTIEH